MTEDKAKTKWCPHAIASHTNPRSRTWADGDKTEGSGPFLHNCIGSDCMAWRWAHELRSDSGYCGLAGAPQ